MLDTLQLARETLLTPVGLSDQQLESVLQKKFSAKISMLLIFISKPRK